jgi:twitching motility protein PilT
MAAEPFVPVMPIDEAPIAAEPFVPVISIDEPAPIVSETPATLEPVATPTEAVVAATDHFAAPVSIEDAPVEAGVGDREPAAAEEPMPISVTTTWLPPVAETPMDVTPELRPTEHTPTDAGVPAASFASAAPGGVDASEPAIAGDQHRESDHESRQAVVVPLARTPIKPETVTVYTPAEDAALMHTLRVAAARGASTVYVVAQSKPMLRIDGEIGPLESEPTLTAADVDRLVMELAPPRRRDALQNGPVEWLCDVPEIGRVRCLTFKDHRGPGVLFRMFPPRAISADQLALTPEVQALCQQADGLVLVTGARASGKSTLLNAFVDLINRTRSDHVITVESQIGFVHESRRSFISQRESRGDVDLAASFARAALREDPDVMMIEDLKSADLVMAAVEAAESGRLVLASVPAASTIGALERILEVVPADRRAKVRGSLATSLRGVIAQVLLRRVKGGRVAAREILLNTPAVSQLVLEGKMFQLPVALDSGRRHGMVPLTDSLAAHVREGTVQVDEAYRKALDRAALVAFLKREGIDTSFAERLA